MTCEATGKPHTTVLVHSHLECLDCRKVIESCCEGVAGRIEVRDVLPGELGSITVS